MSLGHLLNEWVLLKKNSLSSLTFSQYVSAFGSYQEVLIFNNLRKGLLEPNDRTLKEFEKNER